MRAVLLLIVTSDRMNGPDGRGREDKEEKIMSTVLTISTLQTRSDLELRTLFRKAQYDLECSAPGSEDRRDALATLENLNRVMAQRTLCPRPPGF
jgi:hypothetical protein